MIIHFWGKFQIKAPPVNLRVGPWRPCIVSKMKVMKKKQFKIGR